MTTSTENVLIQVPVKGLLDESGKFLSPELRTLFKSYTREFLRGNFEACEELASAAYAVACAYEVPSFESYRQAFCFHEKLTENELSRKQVQNALEKFAKMEWKCYRTNKRLRFYSEHPYRLTRRTGIPFFYNRLRAEVSKILGPLSTTAYDKIRKGLRFGPGMTVSSTDSSRTSVPWKLLQVPTITSDAVPIWRDFIDRVSLDVPWWQVVQDEEGQLKVKERVRVVPGNRVTFVPKTSVISRAIAIEPSANVAMQLGVHSYLASRLARTNNDITDQRRNRRMALTGSSTGEYATIDLSSASDTVSFELVRMVLPSDWFKLLDGIRCYAGDVGDDVMLYEKFSSMGNGFTFALESILFLAIARVACGKETRHRDISVYGDDIIVPTSKYNETLKVLRVLGFLPNMKKSFGSGPFRESCGLDGFRGVDVRPVFLRKTSMSIQECIELHNSFWLKGLRGHCEVIASSIPLECRLWGPLKGRGARGYLYTDDEALLTTNRRWSKKLQSFQYLEYEVRGERESFRDDLLLMSNLFDGGSYSRGAPLRGLTRTVRVWST